jgi:hypothetical protein
MGQKLLNKRSKNKTLEAFEHTKEEVEIASFFFINEAVLMPLTSLHCLFLSSTNNVCT